MKFANLALGFAVIGFSVVGGHAAWQRVASTSGKTVVVSNSLIQGVKLVSSQNIGNAESMLSDGVSAQSTLSVGAGEAVFDLGRQLVIEHVGMANFGAEGKVAVLASADNESWIPLGQSVFSPADSGISMAFPGAQGKFVKVQFDLTRGGSIRAFSIHGSMLSGSEVPAKGKATNMAGAATGARVIYTNPSPSKDGEGTKYGSFSFPESDERYRTVIYDLGKTRVLKEFGSVHSPRPVRFEVFTFGELPEKEDWKGRRTFDPAALDTAEPVAVAEDPKGMGYVKVKPQTSISARFVALRWEPDYNPPAFMVFAINLGGNPVAIDANDPGGVGGGLGAGAGGGEGAGENGGEGGGEGGSGGGSGGGESISQGNSNGVFSGPFAPNNSLAGAGSGGLSVINPPTPPGPPNPPTPPRPPVIRPVSGTPR